MHLQIKFPEGDTAPFLAHVLSRVTGVLPAQRIQVPNDFSPQESNLADTHFYKPGVVDLLVGVEVYEALMLEGKRPQGSLMTTRSRLGWVVTGTASLSRTTR